MSIKTRVLWGFLLTILVMVGGIIPYVVTSMRSSAEEAYFSGSSKQLQIMDDYVSAFIMEAERSAAFLAGDENISSAMGLMPDFSGTKEPVPFSPEALPQKARAAVQLLTRMDQGNTAYVEVYMGSIDGSYATSIAGSSIPAGYVSNKRGWFTQRASSSEPGGLAESYLSITGELVVAATHKINDQKGDLIGILGVDVSLDGLSEHFKKLNFGETGYFLLIENTGRILCSPRQPELTGKIIGKDILDEGLAKIYETPSGSLAALLQDAKVRANIVTTDFGWKIIAIQAESEIFDGSNAAIRNITFISIGIALAMLLLAYCIVRSINRPLSLIVREADKVAQGNLDVQLEAKAFYGELSELRASLLNMVGNLQKMIETAQDKSREAEEQALVAKTAMAQAETSRLEAENARREGTLAAAAQLEGVVSIISSASSELAERIEQSERISVDSAHRLQDAAGSMNQMNTAVREVANNASSASAVSNETKANAKSGTQVVHDALQSIRKVLTASQDLKEHMGQLNTHAQAIDQIMSVISDIADQTNLLALNAAIEAARAGDAGRGFAVVADEVRKLAEKTTASTHDVENAVKAIHESMGKSVAGMDDALEQIKTTSDLADESGRALQQILDNVETTAAQVDAIATASEEQSVACEGINQSILEVNEMAGQTMHTMEEAAKTVDKLAEQANALSELITMMKQG